MKFHCVGILSLSFRFLLFFSPREAPGERTLLFLVVTGAFISPPREDKDDFFYFPAT